MVMSRRSFVQLAALGSGALMFGVRLGWADEESHGEFHPNAWLRIDADGVLLVVGKSEMGQGVRTSLPMILAEELDADFAQVRIEQASPGPDFQSLGTGGSGSVMRSWDPLRQAGAAAREMLVAAAAARWGVDPTQCRSEKSRVMHTASGRSLGYGELAGEAARQEVPPEPRLKSHDAFTLVGTPQRHLDGPDVVTGRARYGLDVKRRSSALPFSGVRYAPSMPPRRCASQACVAACRFRTVSPSWPIRLGLPSRVEKP